MPMKSATVRSVPMHKHIVAPVPVYFSLSVAVSALALNAIFCKFSHETQRTYLQLAVTLKQSLPEIALVGVTTKRQLSLALEFAVAPHALVYHR